LLPPVWRWRFVCLSTVFYCFSIKILFYSKNIIYLCTSKNEKKQNLTV
jgi:hypothetical protein